MQKFIHYAIIIFFYAFLFAASGGFFALLELYTLPLYYCTLIVLFIVAYLGSYLTFKMWPNQSTLNVGDYPGFIKGAFLMQFIMGLFLLVGSVLFRPKVNPDYAILPYEATISKLSYEEQIAFRQSFKEGIERSEKEKNVIGILGTAFLIAPWIIRKISMSTKTEPTLIE